MGSSSEALITPAQPSVVLTFAITGSPSIFRRNRYHTVFVCVPSFAFLSHTETFALPSSFVKPIALPPGLLNGTPVTFQLHSSRSYSISTSLASLTSSTSPSLPSSNTVASATVPFSRLRNALHSTCVLHIHQNFLLTIYVEPTHPGNYHSATFFLCSRAYSLTFFERLLPIPVSDVVLLINRRRYDGSWAPVYRSNSIASPKTSTVLRYPPYSLRETVIRLDACRLNWRNQLQLLGSLHCSLYYLANLMPDTAIPLYPPFTKTKRSLSSNSAQLPPLAGFVKLHGAALAAEAPHASFEFTVVLFATQQTDDGGANPTDPHICAKSAIGRGSGALELRRDAEQSVPSFFKPSYSSEFPRPESPPYITPQQFAAVADRKWRQWKPTHRTPVKNVADATLHAVTSIFSAPVSHQDPNGIALDVLKHVDHDEHDGPETNTADSDSIHPQLTPSHCSRTNS